MWNRVELSWFHINDADSSETSAVTVTEEGSPDSNHQTIMSTFVSAS